MALILGTNGNDTGPKLLWGTGSADQIFGFAGNDLIHGNGGADILHTGLGFDTVRGGAGNDTVRLESWQGDLDGESGTDTLILSYSGATDTVFDLAAGTFRVGYGIPSTARGFENLTTGAARDSIGGTEGANVIDSGSGNDRIDARGGNDVIRAGAGNDTVKGGSGNDLIDGGAGSDRIDGGSGHDTLSYATASSVTVDMTGGMAKVGASDVDTITNVERIVGSAGHDRFIAGSAAIDFDGAAGHDHFTAGAGANRIDGGSGSDTVSYAASTGAVAVNLATGLASGGHAQGDRLSAIESLTGSNGGDQLTGNATENTLYGLAGSDEISGGAGKDVLVGGAGKDFLTGGSGADIFIFGTDDAGARDVIHDFQRGTDKIYLGMDGNDDRAGTDDFRWLTHYDAPETNGGFKAGTINIRHDGQSTIVELNTSDALVHGRDVAEYAIELSGRIDLQLSDFML